MGQNRVGDVLAAKYRLEELLGSGGMGHVYRAVNEDVGRIVAIKLLRAEHAQSEIIRERFLREAKAANLVRHPNVVDVLDIGRDEGGAPFIVQELLTGEDLSKYVERRGGKLDLDEVVDLLCPVIAAVAEAHARGIVHRDIKPENVFLAKQGQTLVPKLLDFGISKLRESNVKMTEVGVMMGTPAYMPPEQVQGARDADPRSDVWAIGVMLFELIAGRLPFDVPDAPALFVAIVTRDAPTLLDVMPSTPPSVSKVVERCLRRNSDERYPSASELARDLRLALIGAELEPTGKHSLPPSLLEQGVPPVLVPKAAAVPAVSAPPPAAAPAPAPIVVVPAPLPLPAPGLANRMFDTVETEQPTAEAGIPAVLKEMPAAAVAAVAPVAPAAPVVPDLVPDLIAPAPRSSGKIPAVAAAPAGAAPAPKAAAAAPAAVAAPPSSRRMVAAELSGVGLSGVGLAPGAPTSSTMRRPAMQGPPPDWRGAEKSAGVAIDGDAMKSVLVGLGVVGLVVILVIGVLMKFAHQIDGWPLIRFLTGPRSQVATIGQGVLGLLAVVVGGSFALKAHKTWRGELAGGGVSAVFNAVLAGAAVFAGIELASAAW